MTASTRRHLTAALIAGGLAAATFAASTPAASAHEIEGPLTKETKSLLQRAKEGTEPYRDFDRAVADGFVPDGRGCVVDPEGTGTMGYRFINMARVFDPFDATNPEVLIYNQTNDGAMKLVAVEYIVVDSDQDPTTSDHPHFSEQVEFHGVTNAGAGWFYPLHAWLWKHNPNGVFTNYNPEASCPGA
jgi:hypothetical protein